MRVRRGLRRLKRVALLGAATGTVIAVRRARVRREPPVAAVGDLATVLPDRPQTADGEGQNAVAEADDYRAVKGSVIDP